MRISRKLDLDDLEYSERFVQSSGPGGQNVNKVATAVELRFHIDQSDALPSDVRSRIKKAAGNRLTDDGDILIVSQRYRTQSRNRTDARKRLAKLVRDALTPPKKRKKTRVPAAVRRKRLESKKKQSEKKRLRKKPPLD